MGVRILLCNCSCCGDEDNPVTRGTINGCAYVVYSVSDTIETFYLSCLFVDTMFISHILNIQR